MENKIFKLKEELVNISNFTHIRSEFFQGANLIITDDKNRVGYIQDVIVYSENAENLSWFVFRLKKVFFNEINSMNKYSFYSHIGNLLNEAIKNKLNCKEQMLYVLDHLNEFKK